MNHSLTQFREFFDYYKWTFEEHFWQDDGDRKFAQQHKSFKFASGKIKKISGFKLTHISIQNKNWPEYSRFKPAEKEENHLEHSLFVISFYRGWTTQKCK